MKKTKIIAIISVLVILMGIFAACADDKTTETVGEGTSVSSLSTTENASEDNKSTTKETSTTTTTKATTLSTTAATTKATTEAETTTRKPTTTKKVTTTKKRVTTTKKKVTTTKKKVTTTKKKVTTTKKKVTTTKANLNKPLTASQKQWVINNWFGKFPQYGAASGFRIVEMSSTNGLTDQWSFKQSDYKSMVSALTDTSSMNYFANGCTDVAYYWKDTSTESILYYKCEKD